MARTPSSFSTKDAADTLQTDIRTVANDLRELASHTSDVARQYTQQAKTQALEMTHKVEGRIAKKPLASVLVAFGAGYVLSKIL